MGNLKSGDILIFEAGDNWLSKCIAKLTSSNVSHAAMCYEDGSMVEMGSKGIACSPCGESEDGDKAYHLRLAPERNPAPLLAAAKKYLDEGVYYDYPDLVFFAGLIIYHAIRPTQRWQKITDYIIELACAELDKLLNKLIHKDGKPAMVCSQLVYQIYLDCGADYEIKLHNPLIQSDDMPMRSLAAAAPDSVPDKICLAALAEQCNITAPENPLLMAGAAQTITETPDMEAIAKQMCEALEEESQTTDALCASNDLNGLVEKAGKFLDKVERILEAADVKLPVYALFVAPCDFLSADNLDEEGSVRITRKKAGA